MPQREVWGGGENKQWAYSKKKKKGVVGYDFE